MEIRVKQRIDYVLGYLLIGLLVPVTRLLGVTLRRDHALAKGPRCIVFIKLLGLGSLIVASDAIMAIRRKYPDARLILLTDANIAAGIAPFDLFDDIQIVHTGNPLMTAGGVCRFLFRCWRRRLWVIDLEVYSKLTTVLALLTLATNRFGFILSPVVFRRLLNTHNIVFDPAGFLEDNYTQMAGVVTGGDIAQAVTSTPAPPRSGGDLSKPFILLNNTCSGLAYVRRLPDSTFSEICEWILDHTAYCVALLGSPGDREDIDRFIGDHPGLARQRDRIVNVAGRDFPTYYRFLREEGVCLITIDSGPLHIARKLGLPTLSVWGPTDPANYLKVTSAEQDRHLTYYGKTGCSPCVHRYHPLPCGGNNVCMQNISARALIGKIEELLHHLA